MCQPALTICIVPVASLQRRSTRRRVHFGRGNPFDTVGLPRELFSPAFGAARMAGWCAHFDEQRETGRLIRPDAELFALEPEDIHLECAV